MATTKKTTAPRQPEDHKTKQPTAAERLKAEALDDLNNLTVDIGGESFPVKHPDDWSGVAADELRYGSWTSWMASAIEEEHYRAFTEALANTSSGDLKKQRARMQAAAMMAAQDMGEGDGSLSS